MSGSALRLILFDVDGTLCDSRAPFLHAFDEAARRAGLGTPVADPLEAVGLSLPQMFAHLYPQASSEQIERAQAAYRAAWLEARAAGGAELAAPLYPGTRGLLDRLASRDDLLLGIATGKARRGVQALLDHHGLGRHFATVQTADTNPSKPAPDMVHTALAETGVAAADSVVVGDSTHDVEMARAAGVEAIGVAWGFNPPERLRAAGVGAVIDSWARLDAALGQIWEGWA